MNDVALSDDRMKMVITNGLQRATAYSARPEGFIAEDIRYAREEYRFAVLQQGQVSRARRFTIGKLRIYFHLNTGPPAWRTPKIYTSKSGVSVGWLRAAVGIGFDWN